MHDNLIYIYMALHGFYFFVWHQALLHHSNFIFVYDIKLRCSNVAIN